MYNISVIIPTYNRGEYIERAIQSVLDQKNPDKCFDIIEVIIVDDGSTDNTRDIVEGINDKRISYYKMPVNSGAAAARNKGVSIATGEWIAFQDSDDLWHENKLSKQTTYIEEHPDCCMVTHPFRAYLPDDEVITTRVISKCDIINELAESNCIGTPTILVKKDAFQNVGGFDPDMKALQDWEFTIRFGDKYDVGMVPEVLLDVDMKVEGISANPSKHFESRCRLISKNKEILIKHGCFNSAVRSLLLNAQNNSILEPVSRMLELYLTEEQ